MFEPKQIQIVIKVNGKESFGSDIYKFSKRYKNKKDWDRLFKKGEFPIVYINYKSNLQDIFRKIADKIYHTLERKVFSNEVLSQNGVWHNG